MRHAVFLTILSILLLTSCQRAVQKPITVTEVKPLDIPMVAKPPPVQMNNIYIYVVNEPEIEEFLKTYKDDTGSNTFYAISVKDYENLSMNFAELKRYILQQKSIVSYYENAITELKK